MQWREGFHALQPTVEMTAFGAHAFDAYSGRYGPPVAYLVVTGPEKIPQAGRRMGFGSVVDVLGATGRLPGHLQLVHVSLPRGLHLREPSWLREQQGFELIGLNVGQKLVWTASGVMDDRCMEFGFDGRSPI